MRIKFAAICAVASLWLPMATPSVASAVTPTPVESTVLGPCDVAPVIWTHCGIIPVTPGGALRAAVLSTSPNDQAVDVAVVCLGKRRVEVIRRDFTHRHGTHTFGRNKGTQSLNCHFYGSAHMHGSMTLSVYY
jgi:hypothetical protein